MITRLDNIYLKTRSESVYQKSLSWIACLYTSASKKVKLAFYACVFGWI